LSKRKSVRSVARIVVPPLLIGAAAVCLVYAKRLTPAEAAEAGDNVPQIANRGGKSDRLVFLATTNVATAEAAPTFALASAPAVADPEFPNDTPAMPALPKDELLPSAAPAGPKHAAVAPAKHEPAPLPPAKPKRAAPPSPFSGILDDSQISGLRGRLRLTSDQEEYWPAVEAALRDVVRTQFHGKHLVRGGKPAIDVNSAEVQKLIWAAMPLLMRLREDQKGEVRKLARVIGLEQVASQI
jgi:hypothetical protein